MRTAAIVLAFAAAMVVGLSARQVPPSFEVASIRPSADALGRETSEVQPSGRFVAANMTLDNLVRGVFEVQRHELVVGDSVPSWFASQKWDIIGQGPPITDPAGQQPLLRRMMQNLLVERFKMVTRRDVRQLPVYALAVARSDGRLGPQMRPSSADCAALGVRRTPDSAGCGLVAPRGFIRGTGISIGELVRALTRAADRPVVDATGLTGVFDLELTFTPVDAPEPTVGASLFTAIQEQLGLRLEPRRAPINVLVIESVERPRAD